MNYTSRLGSIGTAASGPDAANKTAEQDSAKMSVSMIVNGQARTITVEPRMTLLDAFCEELGLTFKLYDLAAADEERRFSPYCWRIKMALAHKELGVETIPWRFIEKDAIAFSGQGRVPVLVDGEKAVADSWAITNYREDRYADRKSLFGGMSGRAPTRFIASWADGALLPAIAQLVLIDVHAHLHEKDKAYFRESREKRLGTTLEKFCANRDETVVQFRKTLLAPLRLALGSQPFLGGAGPTYADYAVFGAFQWARAMSPFKLLEPDDPVAGWRERMLDLYGGFARMSVGYPV